MTLPPYKTVYPCHHIPEWKSPLLGLDIETAPKADHPKAGLDPWMTRLSLVQIYDGGTRTCYVYDVLEKGIEFLLPTLRDHSFIAHNAKFELTHLIHAGAVFTKPVHCTMLMSQLIGSVAEPLDDPDEDELDTPVGEKDGIGAYKRTSHSLEMCCIRWLSHQLDKQNQTSKWGMRPLTEGQVKYAAEDAVACYELFRLFIQVITKYDMKRIYDLQREALLPIVDMETNGIAFDWLEHSKLIAKWKDDFIVATDEAAMSFPGVALASPKQLGEWVTKYHPGQVDAWPKTPKGSLSFTQTSLADFRHLPEIEALFRWKKLNKLLTTYGEEFAKKHRHPVTQRLHTSFTLGETATGRLSSRSPNLQNQPRDGTIRSLFVAPEGKALVVADFSQIELRLQAEISQDPVMLEAYRKGEDIYKVMASSLYGVPIDKVTKEQRTLGKVAMLSLGYGTGAKKLRSTARAVYDLEVDLNQAYQTHKTYHDTFQVYSNWCNDVRDHGINAGVATTLTGKVRKLHPDKVFTTAPNHIIQGTATELLLNSLIKCRNRGLKLLLTVHDGIVVECTEEQAEETCAILAICMNKAMAEMFPDAASHHVADAKAGINWSKAKG